MVARRFPTGDRNLMERHPYFDMWLHSMDELSEHFGMKILERTTLHDWPLSCVQRLVLADGRRKIYKSQVHGSSVEPEFYMAARNAIADADSAYQQYLPQAEILGTLHNSVGMVFEYIDAPRLEELHLSPMQLIDQCDSLLEALSYFPVDLPVYTDISSQTIWRDYADETLCWLLCLIEDEKFRLTTAATVQRLAAWANSDAVLSLFQGTPSLGHGDLGGDNVFVTPEGYKIIDWQRPVRGPAGLDAANCLFKAGLDPLKFASRSLVELDAFIHLRWFVECKTRWFPEGESYDQQTAELADLILNDLH